MYQPRRFGSHWSSTSGATSQYTPQRRHASWVQGPRLEGEAQRALQSCVPTRGLASWGRRLGRQ
eukprot:725930-Pyramimonas_sp.AAC.1